MNTDVVMVFESSVNFTFIFTSYYLYLSPCICESVLDAFIISDATSQELVQTDLRLE